MLRMAGGRDDRADNKCIEQFLAKQLKEFKPQTFSALFKDLNVALNEYVRAPLVFCTPTAVTVCLCTLVLESIR